MTFITYSFYILYFQGWGYLLSNWKYSLPWVLLLPLIDFLLIQTNEEIQDILLYKVVPGFIAWLSGSLLSEMVLRMKKFSFSPSDSKGNGLLPIHIIMEGIIYTIAILPVILEIHFINTIVLNVACLFFLWSAFTFTTYFGRFKDRSSDIASFYLNWIPLMIFLSTSPLIIISLTLNTNDPSSFTFFWISLAVSVCSLFYTVFVEYVAYNKEQTRRNIVLP